MRNDDGMTPTEREVEAALAGLRPARSEISRDRVMFCGGQASVRGRARLWQGLSSALLALLLVSVLTRPVVTEQDREPQAVPRPVARASHQPIESVDQGQIEAFRQYVRTRQAVLDRGVEVLPASSGDKRDGIAPPLTRDDLAELLSST
jgi:hypothetical protein